MTEKKNYRAKAASGERDKLYPVFPGIWLAFQEVETYSFSPWGKVPSGLLEITHCREGRLEYQDSHRAFVLGEGDLSIRQTRKGEAALLCPVKRYRGLSVLIHSSTRWWCSWRARGASWRSTPTLPLPWT